MHIKFLKFVLIAAIASILSLTVVAQTPRGTPSADEMSARVKQLESEVETMRREMAELKAMLGKNASAKPADPPAKPDTRPADVAKTDVKQAPQPKKDPRASPHTGLSTSMRLATVAELIMRTFRCLPRQRAAEM